MSELDKRETPETFSLEIKQESNPAPLVEQPASQSKYHEFRHFMYTHLQNKWIKTLVVAALAAGVIYLLEIVFKAITK